LRSKQGIITSSLSQKVKVFGWYANIIQLGTLADGILLSQINLLARSMNGNVNKNSPILFRLRYL